MKALLTGLVLFTGAALVLALRAGPALADDPASPAEAPAAASVAPYVIEITSVSTDTIPLRPPHDRLAKPPLFILDAAVLRLDPRLLRPLRRRQETAEFVFDDPIEDLADARVILVERHGFTGNLRRHELERVSLLEALPPFPAVADIPADVLITPVGSEPNIFRMLLWPEASWRLEPGDEDRPAMLVVDGDIELQAGDSHELAVRSTEVGVTLAVFRPEKAGSEAEPLEVAESDLGTATLTTALTVRFLGRLAVELAR